MDKSILKVVHQGAKDLAAAGLMDEMTLREFDALCLPPIKAFRSGSKVPKSPMAPRQNC